MIVIVDDPQPTRIYLGAIASNSLAPKITGLMAPRPY